MSDLWSFVEDGSAHSSYGVLTYRAHRHLTALDGGPDTWAATTGRPLEHTR